MTFVCPNCTHVLDLDYDAPTSVSIHAQCQNCFHAWEITPDTLKIEPTLTEEKNKMAPLTKKTSPRILPSNANPTMPQDDTYWMMVREHAQQQIALTQASQSHDSQYTPPQHNAGSRRQVEELKRELAALGIIDPNRTAEPPLQEGMSAIPAPLQAGAHVAFQTPLYEEQSTLLTNAPARSPKKGIFFHIIRAMIELRAVGKIIFSPLYSRTKKTFSINTVVADYRQDIHRRNLNKLTPVRFFGWSLWAMTTSFIVYMVVLDKETVMQYWPQSTPFFALFNGTSTTDTLTFDSITYRYALSTQGPVLELRGILINPSTQNIPNPALQVTAKNDMGEETGAWIIDPEIKTIHPEMETPFIGRSLVPEGTTNIALRARSGIEPQSEEITSDIFSLQSTSGGWQQSAPRLDGVHE